ncbi:MAG: DNA-3-methyladenine glycosylase family protein [Acidimicrobiales bacterium]
MGTRRIELEVRSPFRLDLTVWALRRRPHNTIDTWDGTTYRRTLVAGGGPVAVAVRQEPDDAAHPPRLGVELRRRGGEPSDAAADQVRRTLERTLGLGADLAGFYDLARSDERLDQLARRCSGVRPPRFPSAFEALVNAVACQQLSLTVGIHLLDRLAFVYGPTAGVRAATPGFPTSEHLAGAEPSHLRRLGFSQAKARTLVLLARRVASGTLDLDALEHLSDDRAVAALVALPGIGRWSAEYVLLRGLGRLHVLPGDDVGARNSLRRRFGLSADAGYDDLAALATRWSPFAGMVYFHLLLDGLAVAGHLGTADERSVCDVPSVCDVATVIAEGIDAGAGEVA